jgi:hypothetical protein
MTGVIGRAERRAVELWQDGHISTAAAMAITGTKDLLDLYAYAATADVPIRHGVRIRIRDEGILIYDKASGPRSALVIPFPQGGRRGR